MTAPLAQIRVLDMTRLLPGGICTLMLADLGADVIKIEPPGEGDYARLTPPLIEGMGAYFHLTNRNKRSVILDLKTEAGQAALHKLTASADVLIEGFRPGVMARLHCDYPTLKAINPRLIYCSLSGYGQTGAYALESGHDLTYAARTGLLGEMNNPQPLGGQAADIGGAYTAVSAITAALFRRERTGDGAYLDISLFEAAIPFVSYSWTEAVAESRTGDVVQRGILSGRFACYNLYQTHDRLPVALAALEMRFWENFCKAVERPDLIAYHVDPAHQRYLLAEVQQIFALKTAAAWDQLLGKVDCCYSRVNSLLEVGDDPHIRERGMLAVSPEGIPFMRSPIRIAGETITIKEAPGFGEHTIDVLREAGFTDEEISGLITL
mgnify:FL=1